MMLLAAVFEVPGPPGYPAGPSDAPPQLSLSSVQQLRYRSPPAL